MGRFTIEDTLTDAPVRTLVHGPGGVGKSTFANAPGTIFISAEDGLKNIAARAVRPFPETWQDILDAVDHLTVTECDGVALDSLDWAEPLCWAHVCELAKKKDIEAFGYGKGYTAALNEWRVLLHKLSALHASGKRVTLIAHSTRRTFKNPSGEDFEHWAIKLHEKAAGLMVEWVDVVAFAEHEVSTFETSEKSGRFKGLSTGKRVLRVQPSPAYLAKTRFAMPRSIPLDWNIYAQAVRDGGPGAVARLRAELDAKLAELGDVDVERGARTFLRTRGESVPSLSEALATVETYLNETKKVGAA
jgi:hypothetical protein